MPACLLPLSLDPFNLPLYAGLGALLRSGGVHDDPALFPLWEAQDPAHPVHGAIFGNATDPCHLRLIQGLHSRFSGNPHGSPQRCVGPESFRAIAPG
jgi:hypothetical protein